MNGSETDRKNNRVGSIITAVLITTVMAAYLTFCACTNSPTGAAIFKSSQQRTAAQINNISESVQEPAQTEPARYSFGSIQGSSALRLTPGSNASEKIRFYNVDGNRTTYISLAVVDAPQNWDVQVDSNIVIEPAELSTEPVNTIEGEAECISLADRGYTTAKSANITVSVPDDALYDTSSTITIAATAHWLGQTGQVVICQTRNFELDVEITAAQ